MSVLCMESMYSLGFLLEGKFSQVIPAVSFEKGALNLVSTLWEGNKGWEPALVNMVWL